jgi:hypothetical protein
MTPIAYHSHPHRSNLARLHVIQWPESLRTASTAQFYKETPLKFENQLAVRPGGSRSPWNFYGLAPCLISNWCAVQ